MMLNPEVSDTQPSSVNTKLHWELYLDGKKMDCVRVVEPEAKFLILSFEDEAVKRQVILALVTDW